MSIKKIIFLSVLVLIPFYSFADNSDTSEILSILRDLKKDTNTIRKTTTAEALGSVAASFQKGTTISTPSINTADLKEAKVSFAVHPSAIFAFGTGLFLYSAYQGAKAYINAHKTTSQEETKKEQEKQDNKKAGTHQFFASIAALAATIGLWWYNS